MPVENAQPLTPVLTSPTCASVIDGRSARERILLTAYRLFYAQGVRATGIDTVIREARVTKVTFYRHFPGKQDLVLACLHYRHERWMAWFTNALIRHRALGLQAVVAVLRSWFDDPVYRGCTFINTAVEFGETLPEALTIARSHKRDMTDAVATLLPIARFVVMDWEAVSMAIDGAIVRAQRDATPELALSALSTLLRALESAEPPSL